jgi:hypothetical protein
MKTLVLLALGVAACDSGASVPPASQPESTPAPSTWPDQRTLVQNTYNIAHDICAHDRENIYRQAGTRDLHDAATWYSQGSKEGEHRTASYRGCSDGLLRREKKF